MISCVVLLLSLFVSTGAGFAQCLDQTAQELHGGTSTMPSSTTDTDGDGLTDAFEIKYKLNPFNPDTNGNGVLDSAEDPDGDGLSNLGEQLYNTNPRKADTDGNGVNDGAEDANHNGRSNALEQDRRALQFPVEPTLGDAELDFVCYRPSAGGSPCVGDPKGTKTVALYGDSHAAQWLPALDQAGKAHHWRVKVYAKEHCPSVHVAQGGSACAAARATAEQALMAKPPDLIIVANFSHYGTPVDEWTAGLQQLLAALPTTSKVMVLDDTPFFPKPVPACLKRQYNNIGVCEVPRADAYNTVLTQAQEQTATANGAIVGSMNRWVCPYALCPVVVGHKLIWRDNHHMTVTYSRQLAPAFGLLVAPVLGTP